MKMKVINRLKTSKTMREAKPVKDTSKNPQSFLEVSLIQKEVLPSHKLQTMYMSKRILSD